MSAYTPGAPLHDVAYDDGDAFYPFGRANWCSRCQQPDDACGCCGACESVFEDCVCVEEQAS